MSTDDKLQALCRDYLGRLRYMARKHGLGLWLSELIEANRRRKCRATKREVQMLSRLLDEERISRDEIPSLLNKSYRQCVEDGDFERIQNLGREGTYSKVSALLMKET